MAPTAQTPSATANGVVTQRVVAVQAAVGLRHRQTALGTEQGAVAAVLVDPVGLQSDVKTADQARNRGRVGSSQMLLGAEGARRRLRTRSWRT
jgi:hypothetical protein